MKYVNFKYVTCFVVSDPNEAKLICLSMLWYSNIIYTTSPRFSHTVSVIRVRLHKIKMSQTLLVKFSNIKFHAEMFSSFWVAYIHTDKFSRSAWVWVQGCHSQVSFCVTFILMVGKSWYGKPLLYSHFSDTFTEQMNYARRHFGSVHALQV
jgi:hypothetical protein